MTKVSLRLLILACLGIALAACGGSDQTQTESEAATSRSESSSDVSAADAEAREVVIQANDQMKFSIEQFAVSPGERIRLVLDNVGSMPKFSMGHNVVILDQGVDPQKFVDDAIMAAANDYLPPGSEDQIIAHTKLLGGGEKDTIVFTAPKTEGEYVFLCSFPGHYQLGMKGTMLVQ